MLAAPGDKILAGRLVSRLELDEGAGGLAPFLIGLGHNGRRRHSGMLVERVLDLDRGDVLAPGNDDVFGAVLELDVAVGMHHPEIARVEPAADEYLLARRLVLHIALHHHLAAKHYLAHALAVAIDR